MAGLGKRALAAGVASAALLRAARAGDALPTVTLPIGNGTRPVVQYPQKRPMIRLTTRPPQLETPFQTYDTTWDAGAVTPNDAFFVRYHLANIPFDEIDPETFTVSVQGAVATPLRLSLAEIKAMPAQDILAVNQCSGNSRGFFQPRVAGGQAGNGLMGNASWHGVPLRRVLERAGVQPGAVEVKFHGIDGPVSPETPDFAKSLPIEHAMDNEVMLAWGMNGADLPVLNGYPLRLVVPGYFGTYWVKHLSQITVLTKPLDNFWMATAYRVPDTPCQCVPPGTAPASTRPIGRYTVRSFVTNLADGARVPAGQDVPVRGIAFDGGSGIAQVRISADGGQTWRDADLAEDQGRYAFRRWSARLPLAPGRHAVQVQAVSRSGETQPAEARWNPSGYARNVIETVMLEAA